MAAETITIIPGERDGGLPTGGPGMGDPISEASEGGHELPSMNPTAVSDSGRTQATAMPSSSSPQDPLAATNRRSPKSTAFLILQLGLLSLLSSLDLTVLTPALPTVISSLTDSSPGTTSASTGYIWLTSSFVLSFTALLPLWAALSDIWGRKPILISSLLLFLAGSLICALAPSIQSLIGGRAVQGAGAGGMGMMTNIVICDTFSLRERGLWLGVMSAVWGVGSVVGPVLGGIFTSTIGWRWCFWLNCECSLQDSGISIGNEQRTSILIVEFLSVPIGGLVFFVILFFLPLPSPKTPLLKGLKALDWSGTFLVMTGTLLFLMSLTFGDTSSSSSSSSSWTSPTVLNLLIFGIVTLILFLLNEWKLVKSPIIPIRLFAERSSVASYLLHALNNYVFIGLAYYLPLFSQSALGASPLESGTHLVPLIVSSSLAAAFSGIFIQKTGKYMPLMYISQALIILGVSLFTIMPRPSSENSASLLPKLIGFEILAGVGFGLAIEPPLFAAQAAATQLDTAAVIATMGFMRSIATAISLVVGGVVFESEMNKKTDELANLLQGGDAVASNFTGDRATAALEEISKLDVGDKMIVRDAYFESLRSVWIMVSQFPMKSSPNSLVLVFPRPTTSPRVYTTS